MSAAYAIAVSEELLKDVDVEIQHCVSLTSDQQAEHMKFAIAPINNSSPPYEFHTIDGGEFPPHQQYGKISHSKFSFFTTLYEYARLWLGYPITLSKCV